MKENNSWIYHIEWLIVFITLLDGFYALVGRIDAINSRFDQFMIAWHEESKGFNKMLERQDAEFKAHLMYEHDRRKETEPQMPERDA